MPSWGSFSAAAATLIVATTMACSRTSLPGLEASLAGSGGATTTASSSTGTGGGPPQPCFLALAGTMEWVSYPEGGADGPGLVVLDPGSASAARPARVAHQAISMDANFWHPELRVLEARVETAWPAGVVTEKGPTSFGVDAHAWGLLSSSAGDGKGLALLWYHGDLASNAPSGLKFRPVDPVAWSGGGEVFVDPKGTLEYGTVAYALAPGRSVSGGAYAGLGYLAMWERDYFPDGSSEPRVAVLDAQGNTVLGPLTPSAPIKYPGRPAHGAWSGSAYLVTTSFDACFAGEPLCSGRSVVVTRVDPASQGLVVTAVVPVLGAATAPRRALLAAHDGSVWMAWTERDPSSDTSPRTVRLARLDAEGHLAADPVTIADQVLPTTALGLTAGEAGVVVSWGEDGDQSLASNVPGRSRILVHPFDAQGGPTGAPIAIDATAFGLTGPVAAQIAWPRGVLVTWAASGLPMGAPTRTFLARLDCVVPD